MPIDSIVQSENDTTSESDVRDMMEEDKIATEKELETMDIDGKLSSNNGHILK